MYFASALAAFLVRRGRCRTDRPAAAPENGGAHRRHARHPGRTGPHARTAADRHDVPPQHGRQRGHALRRRDRRRALLLDAQHADPAVHRLHRRRRHGRQHCRHAAAVRSIALLGQAGALCAGDERRLVCQAWHQGRQPSCAAGLSANESAANENGPSRARSSWRPRPARSGEVGFGKAPVHQLVEEGLDKLRAHVAVVDVVGVFPHVHGQQRLVGGGQRRAGSAGVDDVHAAVGLLHQPGPAAAEVADGALHEGFLEGGVAAPLGVDGRGQRARGFTTASGLHAVPEEGVVPDLRRVVVDAAAALLDDLFQRHGLELGALLQVVQVHHIGVVVLAVVELQRLLAVVRGQGVLGVRQCGQGVFHGADFLWRLVEARHCLRPPAL